MKNHKGGSYRKDKPKLISVKVFDGESIIFSIKNAPLKKGGEDLIKWICEKIEGWDYLANMVFKFLSGVK